MLPSFKKRLKLLIRRDITRVTGFTTLGLPTHQRSRRIVPMTLPKISIQDDGRRKNPVD